MAQPPIVNGMKSHYVWPTWQCCKCGATCSTPRKPKSKKDHGYLGLGHTCDAEAVRTVMES